MEEFQGALPHGCPSAALCKREENTQDVSKQMQKLKEEKDTIWKREGNKEHYKFNSEVLVDVQQVLWAVKAGKFEYSGELLEELRFMRSAEVLALRRSDVQIRTSHMEIFVKQSKTDVYRDGAWIIVSRTGSRLCPVCNFELYLKLAGISVDSEEFVFRNLTKIASGRYSLRNVDKPMTYSTFREVFIEAFTTIVQDINQFGLHRLRAGGASAAANSGVPDRMFKRHGRWKYETAKYGYIKDDFRERLNVSMHLNL
ncbi:uncharacterized protein [Argopecten irradians]|uniref:uncharacterized protein n=1 Tax=Argopecten irradians TaxID=31199 RepID=UPI0037196041